MPYLSASEVMIQKEALYEVHVPLPFAFYRERNRWAPVKHPLLMAINELHLKCLHVY